MDDLSVANSAKPGIGPTGISWRKSSWSTFNSNCLEVAEMGNYVLVRDSKDPGPMLKFSCSEWAAFIDRIKHGSL